MAKKIIVLEHLNQPSDYDYRYIFWATVPPARQPFYADPTATSAYLNASAAELTALQTGAVVERQGVLRNTAGATLPQITAQLIAAFNAFQSDVTNTNLYDRYGTYWDGTSWTQTGVA